MIEAIGIAGAILLAMCGVPQAIESYRTKSSKGVSSAFLVMWFIGEILMLGYVVGTRIDWILIGNYALNILIVAVIAYYKLTDLR